MFSNWLRAVEFCHAAWRFGISRVNVESNNLTAQAAPGLLGGFAPKLQIREPGVDTSLALEFGVRTRFNNSTCV